MMFMLLCVLKHVQQWDLRVKLFKTSSCSVERQLTKFLHLISNRIFESMVERVEERWTMRKLISDE